MENANTVKMNNKDFFDVAPRTSSSDAKEAFDFIFTNESSSPDIDFT
jgi:hypothetical protein